MWILAVQGERLISKYRTCIYEMSHFALLWCMKRPAFPLSSCLR